MLPARVSALSRTFAWVVLVVGLAACVEENRPTGSTEPMGEPPELGAACEQTPIATFDAVDGVVPNIVGFDQYGEEVSLYDDLCDKHVFVVRAGFDCGACNENAASHGELYDQYADQGLVVITLLSDLTREITVDEQNVWANVYGLAHPVLADNDQAISDPLWPGKPGRPMHKLLGPGAVILDNDPTHEDVIALFE